MKKTLFAVLGVCMLLGTSCKKDDNSSSSGNTGTLNATEQKLIGTWYLKKEHFTHKTSTMTVADSTWASFSNNPYVKFTSTKYAYAGTNYNAAGKVMTDKAALSSIATTSIGPIRGISSGDLPWYFDGTSNSLTANQYSYSFTQLNGNNLILVSSIDAGASSGVVTDTLWFQK